MKRYLSNPSLLSPSKECGDLFLYLVVSATTIRTALIQEKFKVQRLVYNINQAFLGAKAKYPCMEKITFALIVASKKLSPYFQANPILVMMNQPIKKAMNEPKAAG